MKPNQLIEEIRAVRHRISEECGHDTQRLVRHYQELEATKYANRIFVRAEPIAVVGAGPDAGTQDHNTR